MNIFHRVAVYYAEKKQYIYGSLMVLGMFVSLFANIVYSFGFIGLRYSEAEQATKVQKLTNELQLAQDELEQNKRQLGIAESRSQNAETELQECLQKTQVPDKISMTEFQD